MTTTTPVEHVFETPTAIELHVENGSGSITVTATDTSTTTVRITGRDAEEVDVRRDGDVVSIVPPRRTRGLFGDNKLDMVMVVPGSSRLVARAGSADVSASGLLGATKVKCGSGDVLLDLLGDTAVVDTGSGDVRIAEARAEVRVRSGSGDVVVDRAAATAAVSTGSGDVKIGRADGPLAVKTGSGDLDVADAHADVTMTTGSGDTVVRAARRGRISSKGASGDVRIGIPPGTPVWTDVKTVTGRLSSSVEGVGQPEPGADHLEVRAITVSGDVTLVPA
ncbi:DUF4097 family beta strand repeat-containing protein [Nocardioides sp. TF02-7]|uniref:DUF4097 family beta strand repeat-containing protein n=1 Tax=Nocardioides sp. TF02-7 TaxID=2917724 RepID=UPI001F05C52A|nr:DUF4097 family beta strand repeat-containing protein [Nocardioides sp. TF02-7]UMG94545.1 DUF4097 domain-containing protein [Nocardioides sp. TF02-7]